MKVAGWTLVILGALLVGASRVTRKIPNNPAEAAGALTGDILCSGLFIVPGVFLLMRARKHEQEQAARDSDRADLDSELDGPRRRRTREDDWEDDRNP